MLLCAIVLNVLERDHQDHNTRVNWHVIAWVVVSVLASLSSPQLVCYHNAEG